LKARQDRGELCLLWVKETFAEVDGRFYYRATPEIFYPTKLKWNASLFMPRRVSRLTLEVTQVRTQRLRQISESDAIAESFAGEDEFLDYWFDLHPIKEPCHQGDAQDDPDVVAITFNVYQQNIDQFINQRRIV